MTQEELYSYLEKVFGLTGVKYVTPEKRYTLMKGIVDELAKKANTSTTIAGYGIGDGYTKTEVDDAIANAITTALNTEV